MLSKSLTVLAAMAVIGAGSVGVANAATPADTAVKSVAVVKDLPIIDHDHGRHDGIVGGVDRRLLGGALFGDRFRGGFNDRWRGTYWNRGGVILPYSQVVSSCGCSDPVSLGYTLVEQPQQVQVVPFGAVATGDGSCALSSVNWALPQYRQGVRFFRYHR